ncbi:putative transporter C11D3.18C [Favolaschia claudopus]|uniref:Transporter C11D3.18C n=1 Tax=Favolaschia claudopus TaxID=2862362 RepID=A0AAW0BHB0_9AGAR
MSTPISPSETEQAIHEDVKTTNSADVLDESKESDTMDKFVIDPEAERKLVRKLDWILMPLFTLLCAKRINLFFGSEISLNTVITAIGNAKIAGIEKDLGMVGFDYNRALTIFYVFYIVSDIPSNLALKHFGSVWLAAMVFCFGIISIATAFVKSYSGLIASRVFLGMAEGGTLVCLYYRRTEFVMRVGIFFGISAPLAGAFGGLLASGLLHVGDIGSVKSWRKIFLVEGIITTGIGLLGFLIIPTDPQRTRMLNEDERALALARIEADQVVKTNGRKERTTLRLIWRSFNFNTCLCLLCYTMANISFQGLSLFMPTVIATPVVESQLRTVPPYMVGAVWALVTSYISLRMRQRAGPIFVSGLFMVLGYAIAVGTKNSHASPIGPLELVWGTDNASPDTIRAVTSAIIPGQQNLRSTCSHDAPDYHKGNSLNLGTTSAICVLTIVGAMYIRWENAKRGRGERDHRVEGKTGKELEELGYLHPQYRYQL